MRARENTLKVSMKLLRWRPELTNTGKPEAYSCNPSAEEAERGRSLAFRASQPAYWASSRAVKEPERKVDSVPKLPSGLHVKSNKTVLFSLIHHS